MWNPSTRVSKKSMSGRTTLRRSRMPKLQYHTPLRITIRTGYIAIGCVVPSEFGTARRAMIKMSPPILLFLMQKSFSFYRDPHQYIIVKATNRGLDFGDVNPVA